MAIKTILSVGTNVVTGERYNVETAIDFERQTVRTAFVERLPSKVVEAEHHTITSYIAPILHVQVRLADVKAEGESGRHLTRAAMALRDAVNAFRDAADAGWKGGPR